MSVITEDDLARLVKQLRELPGLNAKRDIAATLDNLAGGAAYEAIMPIGDDAAAIQVGEAFQLLAIEGFLSRFVASSPWFAGYCGVMVSVSDIAAMGGRATAVVNALWSGDDDISSALLAGMRRASEVYDVPIIGGHTSRDSNQAQLAVAILGHARRLLSSFEAHAGQYLISVTDLRGAFEAPFDYWNASVDAPPERLRGDLELLPELAEAELCGAAKDISMAGPIGTTLMLLECSGLGAELDPWALPRPTNVTLEQWLATFPSYGFILSVAPDKVEAVLTRFASRELDAAVFGVTNDSGRVTLATGNQRQTLWDFHHTPLMGCGPFNQRGAGSMREPSRYQPRLV